MQIVTVDPKDCTRWKYADRGNFEFGDVVELASDIKKNGQIEPVHLRYCKHDSKFKYEIIAGSRRWKACLDAELPLKAVIEEVTDEHAAIIQIKENQGLDICDYSKGMYYTRLLEDLSMTQGHLAKNLGISRQKLTNYLYFAKIPQEIWDAVGNVTKVTSRTACTIFYLYQKGSKYIDALLECADDIRKGIGATSLEKLVLSKVKNDATILNYFPLTLDDGTIVGTWRNGDFKLNKDLNINKDKFLKHILKFF